MKKTSARWLVFPTLAAVIFSASPVFAQTPDVSIALHKALYEFHMKTADPGAGINGVSGKMYFEQDETCEAWTTEHRFTTEYQYAETEPLVDTSHYVAFETKDGQQLSFNAEREQDGEQTEQLRGTAMRNADGTGKAIYSRPDDVNYDLPAGFVFPTVQTMDTVRHARAGDHFFHTVMFDGTDEDGPIEVSMFIGKKATTDEIKKIAAAAPKIDASLLTPDAWHVRMSIFPIVETDELTPAYEMDMILHDNGVISYALVDYKTFSVEQRLTALEKLPPPKACH
jgi:hypothetical protein